MKRLAICTAALFTAAALLSGCEQSASAVNLTQNAMNIEGRGVYLRGEMNDYAILSSYRLTQASDNSYCTLAPLRADWAPYRFKFADPAWTEGSNFGFAQAPGILREGSSPVKLNPFSRFEELRYYPSADGVYRFCIEIEDGEYFASVSRADESELGLIDSIFISDKEAGLSSAADDDLEDGE